MNEPTNQKTMQSVDEKGEPAQLGEYNGMEIYPMPMFATIATTDVSAVANWYAQALGFHVVFQGPPVNGQPAMVHLRRRKYQDVLVVAGAAADSASTALLTLSFHADDVDELAPQARARVMGKCLVEGPLDTPWNTRDLRVTDPLGNRLVFTGRNPNADPQQVERMRKMLEAQKTGLGKI